MGRPIDRREFVKTMGAAGALGAMTPAAAAAQAAQAGGVSEFPRPSNLRPGAQLDSRFPVSFAEPVAQGLRLVTEYFTALSQRDLQALSRTLHFPFAIYENIEPVVVQSAADLIANPPPTLNPAGTGTSRIKTGSYDLLESINVHLYLSRRRCVLALVRALHARWAQAPGVRRHLLGDQQQRALGNSAGLHDFPRSRFHRRHVSRCRSRRHSRQSELSRGLWLQQRSDPERSQVVARVV